MSSVEQVDWKSKLFGNLCVKVVFVVEIVVYALTAKVHKKLCLTEWSSQNRQTNGKYTAKLCDCLFTSRTP